MKRLIILPMLLASILLSVSGCAESSAAQEENTSSQSEVVQNQESSDYAYKLEAVRDWLFDQSK